MRDLARCERNVLPIMVVELARQMPKAGFADAFDRLPLLLVRIDEPGSELAMGLAEVTIASSDRLVPTIGFETEISERPATWTRAAAGLMPPGERLNTTARIQAALARGVHFVIPLRKRTDTGRPYEERVTVGRARNSDIVVRDPSVSKFHAWFECDEDDRFFLTDGRSRNGTFVNGVKVTPAGTVQVPPGSEVRLAAVAAVLTTPEILWDVFTEYRPSPSGRDAARSGPRT